MVLLGIIMLLIMVWSAWHITVIAMQMEDLLEWIQGDDYEFTDKKKN